MRLTLPRSDFRQIGLDLEALPYVNWNGPATHRHVISIAWGTAKDVHYLECEDRRPGIFSQLALVDLWGQLSDSSLVVVGHNALRYDLPVLNGVMVAHGLDPLPNLRCQDTMNTLKTGRAYRNSLRDQCRRYGVNLKQGSPDWDLILQRDPAEWRSMMEYNKNDVVSTLQLEVALDRAGIPVPVKTWRARRG